jgi:beta-glucosidase/6-phospho-beta-glucosidase/beta-galactosidase
MTNLVSALTRKHKAWVNTAFPSQYRSFAGAAKKNIKSDVTQWLRIAEDIQRVNIEYAGEYSEPDNVKVVLRFTSTKGETVRLSFINGQLEDIIPY